MRVMHVGGPRSTGAPLSPVGGLDRFLKALPAAQESIGLGTTVLHVPRAGLDALQCAVSTSDWAQVAKIGGDILGDNRADVFHLHDWYGAAVHEHLYRRGHRAFVTTLQLPLRRGFTYRDTGVDWASKATLENRLLGAGGPITAPSAYVADFMVEEYGIDSERIRTVPHGVDSEAFRPPPYDDHAQRSGLLAVGRLTQQKGFDLLVRALRYAQERRPKLRLTIVGEGKRREALERLTARLHLEDAVAFVGALSRTQLVAYYQRAELLVMPSLFEPFGLVGLEAMACGCPVLALAPTGAVEYLRAEELTTAFFPRALGEAIASRLENCSLLPNATTSYRARALEMSWTAAARNYTAIYEALVS